MSDDAAMRALAKHFFDCVETGDVDGLVACYAPDAKIWHNTDGLEQGPEDNRKTLKGMAERIADRSGADLHRILLLGPEREDPGVRQALRRAEPPNPSNHDPRGLLRGDAALPQGGGGAQER